MPKREVDKRKTTKALRKLRKVVERTSGEDGPRLTAWEQDFVAGVSQRLETYGSAFRDLSKGRAEEALSVRQSEVARVIERKSRPKLDKSGKAAAQKAATQNDDAGADGARKDETKGRDRPGGLRRSSFRRKAPLGNAARAPDMDDASPERAEPAAVAAGDVAPATTGRQPTANRFRSTAGRPISAADQLPADHGRPPAEAPPARRGRPSLRLIPGGKSQD